MVGKTQMIFGLPLFPLLICFNVGVFVLGWSLGADAYFTLFIKSIVDNVQYVSLMLAFLAGIKMISNTTVGEADTSQQAGYVLFLGKILYIIAGGLYFTAGLTHNISLLVLALFFNAIANPMVFTTYQAIVRQHTPSQFLYRVIGIYVGMINAIFVMGAVIISFFARMSDLPLYFFAILVFSVVSLVLDFFVIGRRLLIPTRHRLSVIMMNFISFRTFAKVFHHLSQTNQEQRSLFFVQWMFGCLDYISFAFLPLYMWTTSGSLAMSAIIFAFSRLPYVGSFFWPVLLDRFDKKLLMVIFLLMLALMMTFMALFSGQIVIVIAFCIGVFLSMLRPLIDTQITLLTHQSWIGEITGIQEFFGRFGEITGVMIFGFLTSLFGYDWSFFAIACLTLLITMKFVMMNRDYSYFIDFGQRYFGWLSCFTLFLQYLVRFFSFLFEKCNFVSQKIKQKLTPRG